MLKTQKKPFTSCMQEHAPDIAIVDLGLPGEDGLSLIRRWRAHQMKLPILGLTRARKLAG